ncbi:MAG: hypothetical protein JWQ32_44, partial [Marmoricola sp.]|nr:hypothetical protein [Marmoricola sp.]
MADPVADRLLDAQIAWLVAQLTGPGVEDRI